MKNLNIETTKIYDFIFYYKDNNVEIIGLEDELVYTFKCSLKAVESEGSDFFNALNNELFNLRKYGGSIRFERELKLLYCSKFYIVKGSYNKEEDIFKGILIDDTSSFDLNQKTIQAEKLRSIGALVGGIAHDFNNQLMVISGSCELLKRKVTDPKLNGYLNNIETSARNSSDLIRKLLTFSNSNKVTKSEMNLVNCISDTVTILQHTTNKKITIMYDCYVEEMIIYGDFGLIQNALLNLSKNAIESIEDYGVLLIKASTVQLNQLPENIINTQMFSDGLYALIEINDNGCGMSQSILNKVFDPFFTTKGFDKGVGLGLSTVLGTIESHNGLIGVKSEVGKGTSFSVYLKIVKGVEGQMNNEKKRIMIIDDENLVRMVLQDILIDLGYEVKSFESGKEAIKYYQVNKDKIDLVICDMMMPQITGSEVYAEMKKINDKVKFVVLSGYSNEDNKETLEGITDYLTKPIMLNTLSNIIENALK